MVTRYLGKINVWFTSEKRGKSNRKGVWVSLVMSHLSKSTILGLSTLISSHVRKVLQLSYQLTKLIALQIWYQEVGLLLKDCRPLQQ